ncbi:GNAT family N-acetyltransferase [Lacticaseibacillus absianus]|uniref:GNAT family N-acetyltransferase n=1 Tax=Lacticaseibacillus absianus TaxID=2729623 RepID=UPI0015C73683|nr:GNAT family N-acetyltransferase [Lacticaseibacillus absianus]
MTIINTVRLILRPFTETDIPEFYAIQRNLDVNRFLPWFAPATIDSALQMLHDQYLDAPDGEQLAVCLKESNKAIGYVHAEASESHDFGYGMLPSAWGHGYMTEASLALIAALPVADYPYLTATHDVNNPKSGAVMRRLGMTYQYTYLEQWQPKNLPVHFRLYLLNRDGNEDRRYLKYWHMYPEHKVEPLENNTPQRD